MSAERKTVRVTARPTASLTFEATGKTFEEARDTAASLIPEGWTLIAIAVVTERENPNG